ncbi:hypothetical protein C1752_01472 [Acaryochloris thomasi RCC1774]|uniref:Uncharacterized protein n=2 Tax=Acaryochloris TaxID=155977 RepID=A0A2W1JL38_9CYAN|nr:hypothetical protein C1752_01472 [Acaryochloris thomasi RCC1774]
MLLLWLGVLLGVAGVCAGLIASWSALPVGLVIGGCVLLGLGILLQWQYSPPPDSWWRRRSIQAGTNSVIAAAAVIVILGLINFLAVRYPAQVDLTEARLFSLAPQSKQVVRSLQQPLKVLIFDKVTDPQNRTLLEQYQRLSPQFEFEFVDPQAQPGLAQKYQVQTAGAVVLDAGARTKTLDTALTEVNLTAAIANIVSDRQTQVFVIQGHGERPIAGTQASLSEAVEALRRQGFKTELLNIVERQQIPEETDVLIIAGPKRAFLPAEIKLLNGYLQQGGKALLLLDPETEHGLEPVLKQWGITLDRRLVVDASGSGQLLGLGPAVPVVLDYGPHPITEDFAQGISFFPLAQALNVEQAPNQQVTELLRTGGSSWAESEPDSEQLQFDEQKDRQGPLVIGVAIQELEPESSATQAPQKSDKAPAPNQPTDPQSQSASPSPSPSPTTNGTGNAQSSASPPVSPSPSASPSASPSPQSSPQAQAPSPEASPQSPTAPKTPNENAEQTAASQSSASSPSPKPSPNSKPADFAVKPTPKPLARLVVIGDSDFASSGPFGQVLNGDLFLNAVTWLGSDETNPSLSIRPKEVTNRRLQITPQRQRLLTILGALLPVSALGIAVTLWWQRR